MVVPEPLDPRASLWNEIAVYMRHCRVARGLSGERLGRIIGASKSTVSRIETGRERLDAKQARLLDVAWETGGHFERLVFFATLGHRPEWGDDYARFEQDGRLVRIFDPLLVTGLLQTPDYARVLFEGTGTADVETDVRKRMQRQGILDRAFVTVLLSEDAIMWPVGSPAIMREQLGHILELSNRPNVGVYIVPRNFETSGYPGLAGRVSLVTGDDFGEIAYTETLRGGRLVASPSEVAECAIQYEMISGKALPEEQSKALIKKAMEEFRSDDDVEKE